jgi:hypothetical protein
VRLDALPVHGVLGDEVFHGLGHLGRSPLSLRRWSSNRSSANGMFFLYQRAQFPALSPAIRMIAERSGSKANRRRSSERPEEPGRAPSCCGVSTTSPCRRGAVPAEAYGPSKSSMAATTCAREIVVQRSEPPYDWLDVNAPHVPNLDPARSRRKRQPGSGSSAPTTIRSAVAA